MRGIVKNIIGGRNFGFISDEKGIEYFFHKDDFHGHWADLLYDVETKGRRMVPVQFDLSERTDKGPRAENVSRLDHPNQAATEEVR